MAKYAGKKKGRKWKMGTSGKSAGGFIGPRKKRK